MQGNFSSFFSHMSITARILVNQRLAYFKLYFRLGFKARSGANFQCKTIHIIFLLIQDEILLKRNIFWMEIGFFTINDITCKNTTVLVWQLQLKYHKTSPKTTTTVATNDTKLLNDGVYLNKNKALFTKTVRKKKSNKLKKNQRYKKCEQLDLWISC